MVRIVAGPEQLITSVGPGRHVVFTSQVFKQVVAVVVVLAVVDKC